MKENLKLNHSIRKTVLREKDLDRENNTIRSQFSYKNIMNMKLLEVVTTPSIYQLYLGVGVGIPPYRS